MARKAKADAQEAAAAKEPDFDRALKVMQNDISNAADKASTAQGNLSAAWKIIEDKCHVNKRAAKVFESKLLGQDQETIDDFLRSLYGLMTAAGIGISEDLVDKAQGAEPPSMPTTRRSGSAAHLAVVAAEGQA